jgi:CO/xanthine dehydrogenase FAD-binding subunit
MDFLHASSWADALAVKAERPDAVPIAGGTDLMVELNFDRRRPAALLDLNGVAELATWQRTGETVRIGAGVPFTRIIDELAEFVPGLAIASRTVGSPQIRNRGTLGGQLGTASPAGDALPPLVCVDAIVEIASVRGERTVPVREFFSGPKRNVLAADELVRAVQVPVADGPQQFSKVGTRNAMVISICCAALLVDRPGRTVRIGLGSVAPTPVRAPEAESYIAAEIDWDALSAPAESVARFGELVRDAVRPITDHRGSSAYRSRAVQVIATRALERSLA